MVGGTDGRFEGIEGISFQDNEDGKHFQQIGLIASGYDSQIAVKNIKYFDIFIEY
jgi:hypothetical protein